MYFFKDFFRNLFSFFYISLDIILYGRLLINNNCGLICLKSSIDSIYIHFATI